MDNIIKESDNYYLSVEEADGELQYVVRHKEHKVIEHSDFVLCNAYSYMDAFEEALRQRQAEEVTAEDLLGGDDNARTD